jgi:hypothetical protein
MVKRFAMYQTMVRIRDSITDECKLHLMEKRIAWNMKKQQGKDCSKMKLILASFDLRFDRQSMRCLLFSACTEELPNGETYLIAS